jgi:hypothetical protein
MASFLQTPGQAWGPQGVDPQGGLLSPEELTALSLAPRASGPRGPAGPAQQWWNLPAKVAAGKRIAKEEAGKFAGHHNDAGDAMRHAEWSQRMASEIDPAFSRLAGLYHEGDNLIASVIDNARARLTGGNDLKPGEIVPSIPQTVAESIMDLRNNDAGLRAAQQGVPIDPSRLTTPPTAAGSYLQGGSAPATYDLDRRVPYRHP